MTDSPAARGERYEITGIQKAVGDVFAANWRETPVVHVGIAINMAPAETFRRSHGAQHGQSISIMNIIQRATALAARDHPMIAAMFEPESRTSLIVPHVNDIAVQGPVMVDGSAFPLIIEGASAKSLVTIAKEMQDAVATVRAGKFTQEDSLATFARMARTPNIGISNIGMIAPVNLFTAMSILPAVAHFFVAAAIETPIVNDDGVVVSAPMANFCLAFDHRALSAGPVAAYLGQFKQLMEHPERLI